MLKKASRYLNGTDLQFTKITDIIIPLEKLLQVFLAFMEDGYFAYSKKSSVLKPNSEIYRKYSIKIQDILKIDNLVRLFILYKKAELERKNSLDKKTPIPYYLIGFLGYFIKDKTPEKLNSALEKLLDNNDLFTKMYEYLKKLTMLYRQKHPEEYNSMIKQKIDINLLEEQIKTMNIMYDDNDVNNFINYMRN